ncbi:Hypothetical protein P9211_14241 [Prochlorococcus marinus str. MIT 9211]|uniref:Uncharacterized protein n=1 Tax=Prochlorococcus marinus (strain MIT 9211) TaxID=93059 RepID=A9BBZ3_PROM4|nr:Hypothetical protein P9211_14241 [Prochlorococcus marinus str. MIT 9211]
MGEEFIAELYSNHSLEIHLYLVIGLIEHQINISISFLIKSVETIQLKILSILVQRIIAG